MLYLKTDEEVELLRESNMLVSRTLAEMAALIKPGVTTLYLDRFAETFILDNGATPAFKGYGGFPNTLCTSVNDEVVHGMPGNRKIKVGDIVSIDCGAQLNGYFGDSANTYPIGEISDLKAKLLRVTSEALYKGIEQARNNNKVYDISRAVQTHCEKEGFSLTRELVGHGIGKKLHEEPAIPNFVPPLLHRADYPNVKLTNGMAIAIEPMVHAGTYHVFTEDDGWTVKTKDGKPAAHFEHTVIVNDNKAIILTLK